MPEAATATSRPVLRDVKAEHVFSDQQRPDRFRLQLLGDSTLTATAHLTIVTIAGDTLLSEKFPAQALIDYGIDKYGDKPTDAQRSQYIRKRAAEFFGEERFQKPGPIQANKPDEHLNQAAWQEVKTTELPPFMYKLYEEDGRYLGYSPVQRKAIVFYTCC